MQPSFFFKGQIVVQEQLQTMFESNKERQSQQNYFLQSASKTLYQFEISHKRNKYSVIKNSQQVLYFIEQYNKFVNELNLPFIKNIKQLQIPYIMSRISQTRQFRQLDWFQSFFKIDEATFNKKISIDVKKLSGGRYSQYHCFLFSRWKDCRVYILQDGMVTYNLKKNRIRQFLPFQKDFYWSLSENIALHQIQIHSYHRKLTLKCQTADEIFILIYSLNKYFFQYKKSHIYRYDSFGAIRTNNDVQFFIDGADYFRALANTLNQAENQVFMIGWWISPQFWLVRPCNHENRNFRLDRLLGNIASRGVKIYIIVYLQSSFLTIDSQYTKKKLEQIHQNIKVLRHPQIVLPTYWTHHEKLVVIDRQQAFLGGLDICYGRYDTQDHLIDFSDENFYPGIEYNNCRINDFVNIRYYQVQNIPRTLPRLPWHDVALTVRGESVKDLTTHFIQYWNYASYQAHYTERYVLISKQQRLVKKKPIKIVSNIMELANDLKNKIISKQQRQVELNTTLKRNLSTDTAYMRKNEKIVESKLQNNIKQNFGIQSANFSNQRLKQKNIGEDKFQNKIKCAYSEPLYINLRLGQKQNEEINLQQIVIKDEHQMKQIQFQQQQNKIIESTTKQVNQKINQIQIIEQRVMLQSPVQQQRTKGGYLQQKNYQIQEQNQQNQKRSSMQIFIKAKQSIAGLFHRHSLGRQILPKKNQRKFGEKHQFMCQAVRSASYWSIGCQPKSNEKSIQTAYLQLISQAEKYIYIQNQFFISATRKNSVVKNQIMDSICNRILRAISLKQHFKVIIIMPLVPGFAGELDDKNATFPRVIMNWQYKTICRGKNSLIQRLKRVTNDPFQYIQIYGLRTHGVINNKPTTQIIYLHSKLMIIDDKYLICGSANINDRSMEGDRDSQLCLIVNGSLNKQIYINNKVYEVNDKIHELRVRLWVQHFGISHQKVDNPINDVLWIQMSNIAKNNTQIYRKLFGCYPDDQILTLQKIKQFKKKQVNLDQYKSQISKIRGNIVQFPLKFLENSDLTSLHPNIIST